MRLVVLGLSLSSSWGNGHATTYRALLAALAARGHDILFLERDVPWYAAHRDLTDPSYCRLAFYSDLADLRRWSADVAQADAAIVGSFVPDGIGVGEWALRSASGIVGFYDIDTPLTLAKLASGQLDYLSLDLVRRYNIYLSFTGGPTLGALERSYGSPMARALYCSVDNQMYAPMDVARRWDLSYLGTYSADRQPTLERLLIEPARRRPEQQFVVAGPQYPPDTVWPPNVTRIEHLPPADHAAFYSSSRATLNITRSDMIKAGWSPSVRLFEAAACATPIISDSWNGIEELFERDREIILAEDADDVAATLARDGLASIGVAGRQRVLRNHTAAHRAAELEAYLDEASQRRRTMPRGN